MTNSSSQDHIHLDNRTLLTYIKVTQNNYSGSNTIIVGLRVPAKNVKVQTLKKVSFRLISIASHICA